MTPTEYAHLREAQALATELIAIDGIKMPDDDGARLRLALNKIFIDFITEGRWYLTQFYFQALDKKADSEERLSKLEALRRDEWRCRLCGHTYCNDPGVQVGVHHIIPKGYFATPKDKIPRPRNINALRNLISLCSKCHTLAHHNWRETAVGLFQILRDHEMVKVFKEAGYGA